MFIVETLESVPSPTRNAMRQTFKGECSDVQTMISWRCLLRRDHVTFTWGKEKVCFQAMLPGVQVVIAATHGEKLGMVAALHDASLLHHQDLVGAANS